MNMNQNNYGPYWSCIPQYTSANFSSWNLSAYSCNQDCNHPTVPPVPDGCTHVRKNNTEGPDGQTTCFCPRAALSVGRFGSAPLPPLPPPPPPTPPPPPPVPQQTNPVPRGRTPPPIQSCAYGGLTPRAPGQHNFACPAGAVLATALSSPTLSRAFIGDCCDACVSRDACDGYRVLKAGSNHTPNSYTYTCNLIAYDETTVAAVTTTVAAAATEWCGSRAAGPRIGGSWNWDVADMMGGWWYSTLEEGQCSAERGAGGRIQDSTQDRAGANFGTSSSSSSPSGNADSPAQCAWQVRGKPRFVEASCVLDTLDTFVEALPEMRACLERFGVPNPATPAMSRNTPLWFRCYWQMVGGGGFPPVVSYSGLIAVFARAFVPGSGCPPVQP